MKDMLEITDNNFNNEVLGSNNVVMIDFYAEWCGPCKMMSSIMQEINKVFSDKIKICKANIEECKNVISDYEISAIPAILFFKNGKVIKKNIGVRSKSDIEEIIRGIDNE